VSKAKQKITDHWYIVNFIIFLIMGYISGMMFLQHGIFYAILMAVLSVMSLLTGILLLWARRHWRKYE
jgi:hypothetical protein